MFVCFALSGATGFLDVTSSLYLSTVDRISIYTLINTIQHLSNQSCFTNFSRDTASLATERSTLARATSATDKGPSNLSKVELKRNK
jgi:hypothetical protein